MWLPQLNKELVDYVLLVEILPDHCWMEDFDVFLWLLEVRDALKDTLLKLNDGIGDMLALKLQVYDLYYALRQALVSIVFFLDFSQFLDISFDRIDITIFALWWI